MSYSTPFQPNCRALFVLAVSVALLSPFDVQAGCSDYDDPYDDVCRWISEVDSTINSTLTEVKVTGSKTLAGVATGTQTTVNQIKTTVDELGQITNSLDILSATVEAKETIDEMTVNTIEMLLYYRSQTEDAGDWLVNGCGPGTQCFKFKSDLKSLLTEMELGLNVNFQLKHDLMKQGGLVGAIEPMPQITLPLVYKIDLIPALLLWQLADQLNAMYGETGEALESMIRLVQDLNERSQDAFLQLSSNQPGLSQSTKQNKTQSLAHYWTGCSVWVAGTNEYFWTHYVTIFSWVGSFLEFAGGTIEGLAVVFSVDKVNGGASAGAEATMSANVNIFEGFGIVLSTFGGAFHAISAEYEGALDACVDERDQKITWCMLDPKNNGNKKNGSLEDWCRENVLEEKLSGPIQYPSLD